MLLCLYKCWYPTVRFQQNGSESIKVQPCFLQDLSPEQWMYANVITLDCQLFMPLPDDSPMGSMRLPQGPENGLNFTWRKLRLARFWGGDGETTLRFDADDLSAAGHVNGSLHGCVRSTLPLSKRTFPELLILTRQFLPYNIEQTTRMLWKWVLTITVIFTDCWDYILCLR